MVLKGYRHELTSLDSCFVSVSYQLCLDFHHVEWLLKSLRNLQKTKEYEEKIYFHNYIWALVESTINRTCMIGYIIK